MMKKYLLAVSMMIVLSVGHTFATQYDCGLVANGPDKSLGIYKKYLSTSLIDQQVMRSSLQHLADYCCKKSLLNTKAACDGVESRAGGAESPYIFDQLIDMSFRRIDAYNDETLRYSLTADTKGVQRQTVLTSFASPTTSAKPEDVINTWNIYRPNQEPSAITTQTDTNCGVSNIENISLYGRYKAACNIAVCLSNQVTNALTESQTSASLLDSSLCGTITSNRYVSEASYIKQLLTRVGIRTVTNLIEQYTKNYFVSNRRQSLYEEFSAFNQNLMFVNRKVEQGTPVCSSK